MGKRSAISSAASISINVQVNMSVAELIIFPRSVSFLSSGINNSADHRILVPEPLQRKAPSERLSREHLRHKSELLLTIL